MVKAKEEKRKRSSSVPRKLVRIGMLSLGCPKNLVDSEVALGTLDPGRYVVAESAGDCDVALVNTCGFILDARKESVDLILELIELKKEKRIRAVIVMGCLVQRFPRQLQEELREVDAFIGSGDYEKIPEIVRRVEAGEKVVSVGGPGYLGGAAQKRVALTPSFYRYLKISEGCDHLCTFCAIPFFRGAHRSRPVSDVVAEARRLIGEGARELILTGQDTSDYGRDQGGKFLLPRLLRELDGLKGGGWIRLLYNYPTCVTDELIETIRASRKICHYLDLPLQHASDRMLRAMRRGITRRRTLDLIDRLRRAIPDAAVRTAFIVGFPGETDRDFSELLDFMRQVRFERLGIFIYSPEQGTPAAEFPGQVPERIKQKRFERAMLLQQEISAENNKKMLGRTLEVLIENPDEKTAGLWVGRSAMDAPEVDGSVFVRSKRALEPGKFINVKITSSQDYDLVGEVVWGNARTECH